MEPNTPKQQFTKLYANESDAVYRFCLLRTSDKEVALDIMQDTFMSFWEVLARGDVQGGVQNRRAFLFTIARNRIIDWYRKKKSLSLDALAEKSEMDVEAFMIADQKKEIELTYEARFLIEKIREIEPSYQQVIYFRFVEDLRPKEIAQILGVSVNVVSVRIHRGIKQLRKVAGYDEHTHEK